MTDHFQGPGTRDQRPETRASVRRAFTLIELLVVLAVTAVLMVMLFGPLSRALDLVRRGQATVQGQDQVRKAMRLVTRELANAMVVYEPAPLQVWGYNSWDARGRLRPAAGAAAEASLVASSKIAFRLPKHRYYCTRFHHSVTQQDIDQAFNAGAPGMPYDMVALANCPRTGHQASPLDIRPQTPMEPEDRIVIYFIGLKNPALRDGSGRPVYDNLVLFRQSALATYPADHPQNSLNTYALYRVEFDPSDANFANWQTPGFFYDTTAATGGNGLSYSENWYKITRRLMDVETADAIRWTEMAAAGIPKWVPQPLCTFTPTMISGETAQPNRSVGQYTLNGSALLPDQAPLEYNLDHGNWLGMFSLPGNYLLGDGNILIPDTGTYSTLGPGTNNPQAPRIQVIDPDSGLPGRIVFDSGDPALRHRLVSYDALTGRVLFGVRRQDTAAANQLGRDYYSAAVRADQTVDLGQDTAGMGSPTGPAASLGAARNWASQATLPATRTVAIIPGSDEVQLVDDSQTPPVVERLHRVGWQGLSSELLDAEVPQSSLGPDEYTINYSTGIITLANNDPTRWINVGPSQTVKLMAAYALQTNRPKDVVRVSYTTRELMEVKLGIVEYTRSRQEVLPFEVSQKVSLTNIRK